MNCVGYKDIEIEASSKEEAIQIVKDEYHSCEQPGMEYGEIISITSPS